MNALVNPPTDSALLRLSAPPQADSGTITFSANADVSYAVDAFTQIFGQIENIGDDIAPLAKTADNPTPIMELPGDIISEQAKTGAPFTPIMEPPTDSVAASTKTGISPIPIMELPTDIPAEQVKTGIATPIMEPPADMVAASVKTSPSPVPIMERSTEIATAQTKTSTSPVPIMELPTDLTVAPPKTGTPPTPIMELPTEITTAQTKASISPTPIMELPTEITTAQTKVTISPVPIMELPAAYTKTGILPVPVMELPTDLTAAPTKTGTSPTPIMELPTEIVATQSKPGGSSVPIMELPSPPSPASIPFTAEVIGQFVSRDYNGISAPERDIELARPALNQVKAASLTDQAQQLTAVLKPDIKATATAVSMDISAPVDVRAPDMSALLSQSVQAPSTQSSPIQHHPVALSHAVQQQVGEALIQNANKSGDIIIRLNPTELGKVNISFTFDKNNGVIAHVVADNASTAAMLRERADLLSNQLKLNGFENINLSFDAQDDKDASSFFSQHHQSEQSRQSTKIFDLLAQDDPQLASQVTNSTPQGTASYSGDALDIKI